MMRVSTFDVTSFAQRYTAAWCSQDAARVASFFAPEGSLVINDRAAAIGRPAIAAAAQDFMTGFPDLKVTMDGIRMEADQAVYRWTLEGHNSGSKGTGAHVRISGFEEWTIGEDGLIAKSLGHFDAADYRRQIDLGAGDRR